MKNEEKKEANKGLFTNTISSIYKKKENYSNVHTYVPSELVPSYKILLKLVSEMWNTPNLKGFKLIKKYNKLQFYQKIKTPRIILVGIQDTDPASFEDVSVGLQNIILKTDLRKLKRYKNDLKDILKFQEKYPTNEYYYISVGVSIAGAISDLFLENGYLHEAITFNGVIEDRFFNNAIIKNYRIYLDEDIFYLAMGKYACNTRVYTVNSIKNTFINPIKEVKHLFHLHTLNNERSSSLTHLKKILTKEEKKNKRRINDTV
jgi:hypothetical protein